MVIATCLRGTGVRGRFSQHARFRSQRLCVSRPRIERVNCRAPARSPSKAVTRVHRRQFLHDKRRAQVTVPTRLYQSRNGHSWWSNKISLVHYSHQVSSVRVAYVDLEQGEWIAHTVTSSGRHDTSVITVGEPEVTFPPPRLATGRNSFSVFSPWQTTGGFFYAQGCRELRSCGGSG